MKKIIIIKVEQDRKEFNPVRYHLNTNKPKIIRSKRAYNRKKANKCIM